MIKKTIKEIEPDVLLSHLRNELGNIIDSWILYRHFKIKCQMLTTEDIASDMRNPELNFLYLILDKFRDDIIARISELADKKVGQLTFHFAARKFKSLTLETEEFEKFVKTNNFVDRRNNYISHKKIHPTWEGNKAPARIHYKIMTRALVMAIRLMKQFDCLHHGDSIKKQWGIMRKKRYDFTSPRTANFMLLPYMISMDNQI